jgi:hypothetical protein
MTGPEHYKEAERLCNGAVVNDNPFPHLRPDELLAAAQVHATLALAAAVEPVAFPPKQVIDLRRLPRLVRDRAAELRGDDQA